jgi:hypothetical protein
MSYDTVIENWATQIESAFREMRGLQLTERQLQRLWPLDARTCQAVVKSLVSRQVLVKDIETRILALPNEPRIQ